MRLRRLSRVPTSTPSRTDAEATSTGDPERTNDGSSLQGDDRVEDAVWVVREEWGTSREQECFRRPGEYAAGQKDLWYWSYPVLSTWVCTLV